MTDKKADNTQKTARVLAVDACPEIIDWWDAEKDKGLDIRTVTAGSKVKFHFKCPKCGEPMYRNMNRYLTKQDDGTYRIVTCQKCTPTVQKNSVRLTDVVPDIEKYWDNDKNEGRKPSEFTSVARDKVWTTCPICGGSVLRNVRYTWETGEDGIGHVIHCRTCGKRSQSNSLVALFPEIIDYWCFDKNELSPEQYTISSGKKVYVRCPECGREKYIPLCQAVKQDENREYYATSCLECAKPKMLAIRRQGDTNIAKSCPDIDKYWDSKNEMKPNELTIFSLIKIFTHCPTCGRLLHRRACDSFGETDGVWHVLQCQKCAITESNSEKALATRGSVLSECPEIKDWWDYDKNTIIPEGLTRGSHHRAFLKCPACNAEFKRDLRKFIATHRNGQLRPVACPECGYSSKENPEDNLLKVCPEIKDWWDYEKTAPFTPEQFSKGSQYIAYLRCPDCGLELHAGIHSLLNTDCDGNVSIGHEGKCRKYRAMNSDNNLVACYPQVKDWWDYEKNAPDLPEEFTLYSPLRAHFKCPDCGTETYRRIADAFVLTDKDLPNLFNCPFCSGAKPIPKVNSLAALYPDLASECVPPVNPERVFPSATSRIEWKCHTCGETWFGLIVDRVNGQQCPYCEGRRVIPGVNSLDIVVPKLAAEWSSSNELNPSDYLPTSGHLAIWKCSVCNNEFNARIRDREVGDDACPFCNLRKVNPGVTSLDVIKPELMAEWSSSNELNPSEILPTSSYMAIWECSVCHGEYNARIKDREFGDDACPYCRERRPLPGFNTVIAKHPDLIKEEWATTENIFIGIDPDRILDNSVEKAWWKCPTCNHLYLMSINKRLMKAKRNHNPCTFCNGRRIPSPRIIL